MIDRDAIREAVRARMAAEAARALAPVKARRITAPAPRGTPARLPRALERNERLVGYAGYASARRVGARCPTARTGKAA